MLQRLMGWRNKPEPCQHLQVGPEFFRQVSVAPSAPTYSGCRVCLTCGAECCFILYRGTMPGVAPIERDEELWDPTAELQ